MTNLSPTQANVMKWLGKKWQAEPSHGEVWTINGGSSRQGVSCTTPTLRALEKQGLVTMNEFGCWEATDAGIQLTAELKL